MKVVFFVKPDPLSILSGYSMYALLPTVQL